MVAPERNRQAVSIQALGTSEAMKLMLLLVLRDHAHGISHLLKELSMATSVTPEQIDQALDTLQQTIDTTQGNVEALLTLIRANPNDPTIMQHIKDKLESMNVDLSGTNFDPAQQSPPQA